MKLRVCKSNPTNIFNAVFDKNLSIERGRCYDMSKYSGAVKRLEEGQKVVGGYLIKSGKEVFGWGVALDSNEFHVYLVPCARKFGAASKVVRRVKKDFPDHYFCPWSYSTLKFFQKRNAPITMEYY